MGRNLKERGTEEEICVLGKGTQQNQRIRGSWVMHVKILLRKSENDITKGTFFF